MMRIIVFLISAFALAEVEAVTGWMSWSVCSQTCGGGITGRFYYCDAGVTDPHCNIFKLRDEPCNNDTCPIDGGVGDWLEWGPCTTSCGGGSKERFRLCDNPEPAYNGSDCTEQLTESANCSANPCPIDGGVGPWADWSVCSTTCAGGNRSRSRECDSPSPQYNGSDCTEDLTESGSCNPQPCPIDGSLGTWESWSDCSTTCGGGSMMRSRECDSPAPQHGGRNCSVDELAESANCSEQPCPIDGGVGSWEQWTPCSTTCGNGTMARHRQCDSPAPQYNGTDCLENLTEVGDCSPDPCPIDGGVGQWSNWSDCTTTCGGGSRMRSRQCDNPAPAHNGSSCLDALTDYMNCSTNPCPVDGGIGSWEPWSECSATCGGGSRQRSRQCDNPAPANNGSDCVEELTESDNCSNLHCPINGGVGAWGNWSDCSTTCGGGLITRIRSCDNPPPAYNGSDCVEALSESGTCNNDTCPPVDGGVGQWMAWGPCSGTCEGGVKTRRRLCDNPTPAHNGTDCTEHLTQTANCIPQKCDDNVSDTAGNLVSSLLTLLLGAVMAMLK